MQDIKNNLHADYVRTGWIYGWAHDENTKPNGVNSGSCPGSSTTYRTADTTFCYEARAIKNACDNGLSVMVIVPPGDPTDSTQNSAILTQVKNFFQKFTGYDSEIGYNWNGCIKWAEIANEQNITTPYSGNADSYSYYYTSAANYIGTIAANNNVTIGVITSGTSGEDTQWTQRLSWDLGQPAPTDRAPVAGFGYHPYNISPANVASTVQAMQTAAYPSEWPNPICGNQTCIYVTEVGETSATSLLATVENLNRVTPTVTIFEYRATPGDTQSMYALENLDGSHTSLHDAFVQAAWYVHSH
jgi:hypothetical protein